MNIKIYNVLQTTYITLKNLQTFKEYMDTIF